MALRAVEGASQMLKFTRCFGEGMGRFLLRGAVPGESREDALRRGRLLGSWKRGNHGVGLPTHCCEHLPFGRTRAGISCCSWVKGNWKEDPRRLGIPRQKCRKPAGG